MLVEAKRKSQNDPDRSFSYNCSAFKDVPFKNNKWYEVSYANGETILMKCTRGRTTLYTRGIGKPTELEFVVKGPNPNKVFHDVVSIKERPDCDALKDDLFEQENGRPVRTPDDVLSRLDIK